MTPIYVESGKKRVFAAAIEWPGWADEGSGVEALTAAAPRYAFVARSAGTSFKLRPEAGDFEVVERLTGSATRDFWCAGRRARMRRRTA